MLDALALWQNVRNESMLWNKQIHSGYYSHFADF
jgi:hypothetical protein